MVVTAIFNAYFVAVVAGNATWATFAWTAALSVSYAAIVVTAPLIGAWADAHAAKKRALAVTTARLHRRNRGAVFRRAGEFRHRHRGAGGVQFLLRHRRKPQSARLPARLAKGGRRWARSPGGASPTGYIGSILSLGVSFAYIIFARDKTNHRRQYSTVTMPDPPPRYRARQPTRLPQSSRAPTTPAPGKQRFTLNVAWIPQDSSQQTNPSHDSMPSSSTSCSEASVRNGNLNHKSPYTVNNRLETYGLTPKYYW